MTHHFTMPSDDEICAYIELWSHHEDRAMAIRAIDWFRNRIKPIERLNGLEIEDLATAYAVRTDGHAQSFYAGFKAAEARILESK